MCTYTPSSILTRIEPRLYPALRGRSGYLYVFCGISCREHFRELAHGVIPVEDAESRPDLNCFYCGAELTPDISDITRRTL